MRIAGKTVVVAAACAVGVLAAWLWLHGRRDAAGFGSLTAFRIVPAHGAPFAVALSPDGSTLAMLHSENSGTATTAVVEVRDVATGREVKTVSLPPKRWDEKVQWFVLRPLRYCAGGKYLLVFSWPETLFVLNAGSFDVRRAIVLSDLRTNAGGGAGRRFGEMMLSHNVQLDCAAESSTLALSFSDDVSVSALKLIDLDSGAELADLSGLYDGREEGDGMAIAPDGSIVAIVTWKTGEGSGVELLDARAHRLLGRLKLGDKPMVEHQLAFAGNGALVVGEPECLPNRGCDHRALPGGRVLRVFNLASGAMRTLGWPGAEVYRSFGAVADGGAAVGYAGAERYCASCNRGAGELKIADARFVVWDTKTGSAAARSPRLRVEKHACPLLRGSCTEYEQAPELEMSANGRAVAAFWPQGNASQAAATEVDVFRR